MEIDAECEALAGRTQRARGQLMAALEGLEDSRLRELLEAYYVEGKTTDQICRERGWSRRYVLRLPPWTPGEGQRVRWGAVRWLYDRASLWWPEGEGAYLGLAFD